MSAVQAGAPVGVARRRAVVLTLVARLLDPLACTWAFTWTCTDAVWRGGGGRAGHLALLALLA